MKIGEAAQLLNVTPATVRNWLAIAPDYFSAGAIRKTGKTFTAADLAALREIQRLLGEGLRYEEIPGLLSVNPDVLDPDPEFSHNGGRPAGEIAPVEFFAFFDRLLIEQKAQTDRLVNEKDARIAELQADKTRLLEEITQLRRPWYRRILGG
jgi:DNA-binding transcriptional MerR regulator